MMNDRSSSASGKWIGAVSRHRDRDRDRDRNTQKLVLATVAEGLHFNPHRRCRCRCSGPCPCQQDEGSSVSSSSSSTWPWILNFNCASFVNVSARAIFGSNEWRGLMLGLLACPLAPLAIPHPSQPQLQHLIPHDAPLEVSSARYIVQQYVAATGCGRLQPLIKNAYIMGRVTMSGVEHETPYKTTRNVCGCADAGCFLLWQLMPHMWSMELLLGCHRVRAGSDGHMVWRHMPLPLPCHAAKGLPRPLRRAIQGVDPAATAAMFAKARCVGEKTMKGGEECFALKVTAAAAELAQRSDERAQVMRHVVYGYFSQRSGLLLHLHDSQLTRVESPAAAESVYWETTIETSIYDYRLVDGLLIAHSGQSLFTLFRFGGANSSISSSSSSRSTCDVPFTKTTMQETWEIGDVVFNVPGLSVDFFIPPADLLPS